jgi:ATP adenylyltransferase
VEESDLVFAVVDREPVTEGHMLVVPKRHTVEFFSMTSDEREAAFRLLQLLRIRLKAEDPNIAGFNVGTNSEAAAGQTVFHAHLHLIPRRTGDVTHPEDSGVRRVIR